MIFDNIKQIGFSSEKVSGPPRNVSALDQSCPTSFHLDACIDVTFILRQRLQARIVISKNSPLNCGKIQLAGAMAESADATDLKSVGGDTVRVRPPLAPFPLFYVIARSVLRDEANPARE
jgi:hypothetical protein